MAIQPKDVSRGHFYVSVVKSVFRILASVLLIVIGGPFAYVGFLLGSAEILGILEELV